MLIKCYGGPCDGQVIDVSQEGETLRIPSTVPMPFKIDDEYKFAHYALVIEDENGWSTVKYIHVV